MTATCPEPTYAAPLTFNDQIVVWDGSRNRIPSEPFDFAHGDLLPALLHRMRTIMYHHRGIGISGCQIGVYWQVCIVAMPNEPELVLINPRIISSSGRARGVEGCLSIAHQRAFVERAEQVTVEYWLGTEDRHEVTLAGLAARALQHELDHTLAGKYFIDRVGRLQYEMIRKKHMKWLRGLKAQPAQERG